MGMKILTSAEVRAHSVAQLGLDPTTFALTSVEATAASLRRSANFLCPCTSTTLVRDVVEPMFGLIDDLASFRDTVQETLESMIALGDFLEHYDMTEDQVNGSVALLYAAPPSFVARESGAITLLGIPPSQSSALPDDLTARIENKGYLRQLRATEGEDLATELLQLGFISLSSDHWLQVPRRESAAQHLARIDRILKSSPPSGEVPGLSILNPESPVRYYRGRWAPVGTQTGRFIARRSQTYGADLWCYIELCDGRPVQLVDFPLPDSKLRGADEAWHAQMAIDAQRGEPQSVVVVPGPGGTSDIQFFSPVPRWAQRRWDAVGEKISSSGCLFAYRITESDLEEELRFIHNMLWLEHMD